MDRASKFVDRRPACRCPRTWKRTSTASPARRSPMSSNTPARARRTFGWSRTRAKFWSRFATTGAGSIRPRDIRATSASTRCAAARSRSAGGSQSRARPGRARWCGCEYLPRPTAPDMAPESEESIAVVVVDDHELVRRGLLAFLSGEPDIDVVGEASGGAEALDLLAALTSEGRQPDVVVMDLKMAPMDGIESTRQVRARYQDIEVVALTSFAEEERVHAALEAGASGYLLKDSDADDVAAAVRAAHRGELQLDPVVARRLMSSPQMPRDDDSMSELTSRELEVLRLVATGKPNKQIAAELAISERTARTHVSRILRKLRLSSRTQAALWAVREGLVEVEREPR